MGREEDDDDDDDDDDDECMYTRSPDRDDDRRGEAKPRMVRPVARVQRRTGT